MWETFFSYLPAAIVLGGVIWAVRLEGRVNDHDTLFVEREKQTNQLHDDVKQRLIRIERKLDGMNGGYRTYALKED